MLPLLLFPTLLLLLFPVLPLLPFPSPMLTLLALSRSQSPAHAAAAARAPYILVPDVPAEQQRTYSLPEVNWVEPLGAQLLSVASESIVLENAHLKQLQLAEMSEGRKVAGESMSIKSL
ncbi:hypothetical protein K438DRAFT_1760038 [Mycena galopus ATCC 62051]|nr:hypothetical protein K438DRAFT_1760038 [Mycena galopus ATCC 62051]